MAQSAELKAELDTFLKEQQDALAKITADYQVESARLTRQIAATQAVLTRWDSGVDTLVDTLATAGITIRTRTR